MHDSCQDAAFGKLFYTLKPGEAAVDVQLPRHVATTITTTVAISC